MKNKSILLTLAVLGVITTLQAEDSMMKDDMKKDAMKMEMKADMKSTANVNAEGVALDGYDAVAFFTDAKPTKGISAHTATYEGATYQFASEKNRATFAASPAKYAPQFGGYCAFGVTKGAKFPVQIETWQIIDGRLFLNKNPEVKTKFSENLKSNIATADKMWPAVSKS